MDNLELARIVISGWRKREGIDVTPQDMERLAVPVAVLLTKAENAARLTQMIEARRVLGTGEENFKRWLKLHIFEMEQADLERVNSSRADAPIKEK